ncbi:MAG TPA: hypothetical protein VKR42_04085, partial [Ktedonobacteraceae bacterium]|nr:hypothetical protein [Ktedonobacteraceae bacterium]
APAELWHTLRGLRKWRWKNTLIFFGTLVVITGAFALLDFQSAVTSQISYFIHRPVQIESTSSSILWLATAIGFPIHAIYTFGSLNIVSTLSSSVSSIFSLLFVLGTIYTLWLQWRGKIDVLQTCIALLFVFIATGKVFSPQYLIWLMPLLAYSCGLDGFWLIVWGGISLLTTLIYPYLYTRTSNILLALYVPGFIQIVAIRNLLFVLLALTYLFNWFGVRRRKPLSLPLPAPEPKTKSLNAERMREVVETPS